MPSSQIYQLNRALDDLKQRIVVTFQCLRRELQKQRIIVGRHNDGFPVGVNLAQNFHDFDRRLGIEVSRRLVGKNQFRIVEKRPCDRNALLFAAGDLVRHFVRFRTHADTVENLVNLVLHFLFVLPTRGAKHKHHILVNRTIGQELEILKNDPDFASQERDLGLLELGQIEIDNARIAFPELQIPVQRFHERALSRPGLPDDVDEFALVHFEVYIGQYDAIVLENRDVMQGNDWFWHGMELFDGKSKGEILKFQIPDLNSEAIMQNRRVLSEDSGVAPHQKLDCD